MHGVLGVFALFHFYAYSYQCWSTGRVKVKDPSAYITWVSGIVNTGKSFGGCKQPNDCKILERKHYFSEDSGFEAKKIVSSFFDVRYMYVKQNNIHGFSANGV